VKSMKHLKGGGSYKRLGTSEQDTLRSVVFPHTSISLCARARQEMIYKETCPLLRTKYSVFMFIVCNFMNRILGK
jgi:hypothetical protein